MILPDKASNGSDFRDTLAKPQAGDFVYLDPPYLPISDTSKFYLYTEKRFRAPDLVGLADLCHDLTDRGVRWLMSNGDTEQVRDLFPNNHIVRFTTRRSVAAENRRDVEALDSPEALIVGGMIVGFAYLRWWREGSPGSRLLARWRRQLAKAPSRLPEKVSELFAENPFWTVNKLSERLDVAFTTAQRAIDRLEAAGIVALEGEARRNRVYCARAILEILEDPPQLAKDDAANQRGKRK